MASNTVVCLECQQICNGTLCRRKRRNNRKMCHRNNYSSLTTRSNNNRMIIRNSSIVFLGLLTCAAVIVQALASPPSTNNLAPWGTRGGAHVAAKKGNGIPSSTTQSALSMSVNEENKSSSSNNNKGSSDREDIEINGKAEIPSPIIRPLNGESQINGRRVAATSNMPSLSTSTASVAATVPHPGKAKKTILTQGGFADEIIPATYVAETNLPTDIGHFRIRAYRIEEFEDA